MTVGRAIDRLVKKTWSDEDVRKYVGRHQYTALTHAADASGGTTSALFIDGLREGWFGGVVVCRSVIEGGRVRARFEIATSEAAVLAASGSKYLETPFVREVLPLNHGFQGGMAVARRSCGVRGVGHQAEME